MDYVTVVTVDEKLSNTIDCANFDGSTFKKNKIIKIADEDVSQFVTVVSVGNTHNNISVNDKNNNLSNSVSNNNSKSDIDKVELVTVYRLPGERIGLGLKFQGGAKSKENIERLFIQSCAVDSPASRVKTAWGYLNEGDEILQIDGIPVHKLTRLECVKCLKESNVAINFLIKNTKFKLSELNENGVKAPPTPPPIPPRKLHKKRVENPLENLVQPLITTKSMSGENSPTTESNIDFGETESDDTGSTISTVIDKFSSYQNFTENDEITNHKDTESNLDKILNTFTMLEKEFAGSDKPIIQEAQMNDLNKTSSHLGPPPPIRSRTIIDEKENINPRLETKIVNNKIHPKEPPIPPPRNLIKVEQAKSNLNVMEPAKLPNCDKSAQQFTTIHNWLQDTSDVIHECAIFIDENENEFNSELYNKQLNIGENNLSATEHSDVDKSDNDVKSENEKNVLNTNSNLNGSGSNNSNSTSSDDDNDDNLGPFDKLDYSGASEAYFNAHWGPTLLPTIGEVDEEFPSLEPQVSATTITEIIINDMDDKENVNVNNGNDLTVVANQNKINLFKNEITEIKINYENVNPNCDKSKLNSNSNNNRSSVSDIINNNLNNNDSVEKIEEIKNDTQTKQEIDDQLSRDHGDDQVDGGGNVSDENIVCDTAADGNNNNDDHDDDDDRRHVVDGSSSCSSETQENGLINENSDVVQNKLTVDSDSENSNHMDHQKNHIIKCANNNDNEKITSISSPPTFSRMPPDGDEFPPNFNESIIVNGGTDVKSYNKMKLLLDDDNGSVVHQPPPPPLPKSSQPIVLTSKTGGTKTYQMYRQDFVIQIDDVRNNSAPGGTPTAAPISKNSVPIIIEDKVIRKKENLIKATLPAVLSLNDNAATNNHNNNNKNNVAHNKIIISNNSNRSNNHNTNLLADTVDMPVKSTPKTPNSFNSVIASKLDWGGTNKCDNSGNKPPKQLRNWREDEKSLKSVRDKIAMFSSPGSENGGGNGMGAIPNRRSSITMKSAENLSMLTSMPSTPTTTPSLNGSYTLKSGGNFTKNRAMSVENLNDKASYSSTPFIPMTPPVSSATASLNYNRTKSVTNSLPRNSSVMSGGRHSILARATSFNDSTGSLHALDNDTERKQKINTILEQRKKSISKLRGLVIPEKRSIDSDEILKPVLLDLPEIKNIEIEKIKSINKSVASNGKENNDNNSSWIRDIKRDTRKLSSGNHQLRNDAGGNITTNSLEYKRIFNNTNRPTLHSFVSKQQHQPPIKPPRTSLIINTRSYEKLNTRLDYESELSDSVSQFSSQKSSPPLSPQSKYPLTRTLSSDTNTSIASSTSTLTSGSGSQASCSSLGSSIQTVDMSRRIQKSSNNETLSNRKNILALARCRNGRSDNKNSDGDSTDGYEEVEYAKTKQMKKSVPSNNNGGDNSIVDKMIKVASYIEVVTDSEVDSEPENIMKIIPTESKSIMMQAPPSVPALPPPPLPAVAPTTPIKTAKDYQKQKVSAAEIRKAFEDKNKAHQQATKTAEMKRYGSGKPRVDEMKTAPPPPPVRQSSLNEYSSSPNGESVTIKTRVLRSISTPPPPTPVKEVQPVTPPRTPMRREDVKFDSDEIKILVTEAEPPLETPDYLVIELKRETPESSIGITLAGGSDYEAKEITIHRILKDSPADKDGRLKKGDRVLGINGLAMKGLTHGESISILKTPRTEVILVITRSKSVVIKPLAKSKRPSLGSLSSINDPMSNSTSSNSTPSTPSKELSSPTSKIERIITAPVDVAPSPPSPSSAVATTTTVSNRQKTDKNVTINKDGCGLGFSIEGGYDSPAGNIPLLVKKVFMGGAAEKSGQIRVGDEITAINDLSTLNLTRVDVWNLMKKLPQGPVKITLR